MLRKSIAVGFGCLCWLLAEYSGAQEPVPAATDMLTQLETHLKRGELDKATRVVDERLANQPDDQQARFASGILHILGALEETSQKLYGYGLRVEFPDGPPMPLALKNHPDPEKIDYEKFRAVIQAAVTRLDKAEESLARVDDPNVKLKIPLGEIRLDFNGDGKATENEMMWQIVSNLSFAARFDDGNVAQEEKAELRPFPNADAAREDAQETPLTEEQRKFFIQFDLADAHWLRGYSHLLRAGGESYLAHDWKQPFDRSAHIAFTSVPSPYENWQRVDERFDFRLMADMLLMLLEIEVEPTEPERLKVAHGHLVSMAKQSQQWLEATREEADDDYEWIPNPNQTGVLNINVTKEMLDTWPEFLEEYVSILEGKTLIPHPLVKENLGINLKKVFHEPRSFDPKEWIHGVGFAPYLEEGNVTSAERWRKINEVFGGNFVGFAFWFN